MPSRRPRLPFMAAGPVAGPAAVDVSAIPPDTRAAVRAALAERLARGEAPAAARFAVAKAFRLTVLKVEAVELDGQEPPADARPVHDCRVSCPACGWSATVSNSTAVWYAQTGCPKCGGAVSRRKGRA